MPRGGINKEDVAEARDALLHLGKYPSIDLVRIELGNTGSKSTIHRYLKELEEADSTKLDNAALLSDTLKDMVGKVASRLHAEANKHIKINEVEHKAKLDTIESENRALTETLSVNETLSLGLQSKMDALTTQLQSLEIDFSKSKQSLTHLNDQLDSKDQQINTIEAKNQESQESLKQLKEALSSQHGSEINNLNSQLDHTKEQFSDTKEQLTDMKEVLQKALDDNAAFIKDNSAQNTRLTEAQTRVVQLESKISVSEDLADKHNPAELLVTKNALILSEKENNELKAKLRALKNAYKKQQIDLDKLKSNQGELNF